MKYLPHNLIACVLVSALLAGACSKQPAPRVSNGSTAPDFTLSDFSGKQYAFKDFAGKVLFVDFWASWCPPCRAASPLVSALHDHYRDRSDRVSVIGINLDMRDREKAQDFMRGKNISYLNLQGTDEVAQQYGVQGIPSFFIIDAQGSIKKKYVGLSEEYKKEWIKEIDSLLE